MKLMCLKFLILAMALNYSPDSVGLNELTVGKVSRFNDSQLHLLAKAEKKRTQHPSKNKPRANETKHSSGTRGELPTNKQAPRMSIEANPLGLLLGIFNAEVNFRFNDHLTLCPVGSYVHYSFMTGFGVGGNAAYYFDDVFEKWFVNGGALYSKAKGQILGFGIEVSGITLYGMGGYKWLWPSFLASLGGGIQLNQWSVTTTYTSEDGSTSSDSNPKLPLDTTGLALLFNIGIPIC